jgi:hypothetical protein
MALGHPGMAWGNMIMPHSRTNRGFTPKHRTLKHRNTSSFPIPPPSGLCHWLFQEPALKSKFPAAKKPLQSSPESYARSK